MLHNNNFVWHWICQYLFIYLFVTMDHQISHKGQIFENEMYTSSE